MQKLVEGNHVYYYSTQDLYEEAKRSSLGTIMKRSLADFIIDRETNTFLKCRYSLEHILDQFAQTSNRTGTF